MINEIASTPRVTTSNIRRPALLAWLRLARAYQKIERVSGEGMRCFGLSMAQFDVLAHVGAAEGMMQQELADSLLVTKGNICQLVDRMEQSGLLVRRQEGRANRLFLTEQGRSLFEQAVPRNEENIVALFSALNSEEQSQLLHLLRKLDRSVQ
ncbi:MAG TPA: MarR family transcriptional regulator [Chloroflexota bacterium]